MVLLNAKTFERRLMASNMAKLLAPAEADIAAGRVCSASSFLREFKKRHKIPRRK